MNREVLLEKFFNALITGDRTATRTIVNELLDAECPAGKILSNLFWPVLEQIQTLYRNDQLANISYHFATRLLGAQIDQMQLRLEQGERRNRMVLVACGNEDSEELAARMTADLLEADGYDVLLVGGGVANDELVNHINTLGIDVIVVFGATPATVPYTRLLVDRVQDMGASDRLQIVVGGGVFNRADGLAEEIGADLWAKTPEELVEVMDEFPERRMTADQRTVGRRHRSRRRTEAA